MKIAYNGGCLSLHGRLTSTQLHTAVVGEGEFTNISPFESDQSEDLEGITADGRIDASEGFRSTQFKRNPPTRHESMKIR